MLLYSRLLTPHPSLFLFLLTFLTRVIQFPPEFGKRPKMRPSILTLLQKKFDSLAFATFQPWGRSVASSCRSVPVCQGWAVTR